MQFINVPDSYYDDLKAKLAKSKVTVKEDMETVSARSAYSECTVIVTPSSQKLLCWRLRCVSCAG